MKTMMVMDTLLVCLGLTLMIKIFLTLASSSGIVQLVGVVPDEFLYIAAFPLVF
jgi:hypothetical protein